MPLNEIKKFAQLRMKGDTTIPDRVEILENHAVKVERQLSELKNHQKKIKEKIQLCMKGGELA